MIKQFFIILGNGQRIIIKKKREFLEKNAKLNKKIMKNDLKQINKIEEKV